MVSPTAAAINGVMAARTPTTGHVVPSYSMPGMALESHPEYAAHYGMWRTIRDCYAGEAAIKSQGPLYLRKLTAHKDRDYEGFLSRAYFYNATRHTHEGVMGSLFRKPPEVTLPPPAKSLPLDDVTLDRQTFYQFSKQVASDVTLMGRYGVLVDLPDDEQATSLGDNPYFSGYSAESIYSWRQIMHRGRRVTDRVILLESETILTEYGTTSNTIVRVLRLDPDPETGDLVYSQEVIRPSSDKDQPPFVARIPITVRGRKLDYIPFVFINARNLLPGCSQPPLMDIATINISHYQSTALLEHGRFYAGMPTYVVSAGQDVGDTPTASELAVGPSNVWELESGAKAWILEFNGHGLTFLENAVDSKQLQMQSLGGKLISSQRKAAALSSEAYSLMEQGDEATLLDIAESTEAGLALALEYLCDFRGIDLNAAGNSAPILVEMNKEFVRSDLTARELRAIQSLYTTGLIPLDVLYYALRNVSVIPVEYSLDDFKALMARKDQLYPDPTGQQQRADALQNKIDVARISAHLDEPALVPTPVDTGPGPNAPTPEETGASPNGRAPANTGPQDQPTPPRRQRTTLTPRRG